MLWSRHRYVSMTMLLTVALAAPGCAERAMIRTCPPGADVTINDQRLGASPVEYEVARADWPENGIFHYRIERPGYEPAEGEFDQSMCTGRIMGGAFSGGLSFLFKRPSCLQDTYLFELEPASMASAKTDLGSEHGRMPCDGRHGWDRRRHMAKAEGGWGDECKRCERGRCGDDCRRGRHGCYDADECVRCAPHDRCADASGHCAAYHHCGEKAGKRATHTKTHPGRQASR